MFDIFRAAANFTPLKKARISCRGFAALWNSQHVKHLDRNKRSIWVLAFHSQEWSISNFSCSPTRNITSYSMENLAFHSLLTDERWLHYQLSLPHLYISLWNVRRISLNLDEGELGELAWIQTSLREKPGPGDELESGWNSGYRRMYFLNLQVQRVKFSQSCGGVGGVLRWRRIALPKVPRQAAGPRKGNGLIPELETSKSSLSPLLEHMPTIPAIKLTSRWRRPP